MGRLFGGVLGSGLTGAGGPANPPGMNQQGVAPNPVGRPNNAREEQQLQPSNARFRSFAERFMIERCRGWPDVTDEEMHKNILRAKTAYKMIQSMSRTLNNDD